MRVHRFKILFLRPHLNVYGACTAMFQLADTLSGKGYKIIFVSSNEDSWKTKIQKKGFRHYTIPLRVDKKNIISFFICFVKILLIVRKEKITIMHSHHRWSSFISFFVSRLLRVPLITTVHEVDRGKKLLTLWGDKIITVSEDAKKHLVEYFNVNPKRIEVIHNGIKLPDINDIKNRTNSSGLISWPTIANIGRMSPEKDQESLFVALNKVVKTHPQVRLLMVGKGPLEKRLRILSDQLGIAKNVEFVGEVDNISDILERIDCFVLPSLTEGLPIAVLEALAFAKPVVATDVGDIPSAVVSGKTGYLVPKKDPDRLASAIDLLLSNREAASEMGRNGRKLVQEKFSVDRMTLETEKVYLDLLSKKHRRAQNR